MSSDARAPRLPPPRKRLGQHFLTDTRVLDRIADALDITKADTVIEIGPGRGALTDRLAWLAQQHESLLSKARSQAAAASLEAAYGLQPLLRFQQIIMMLGHKA
jgi:16S rRNA (adenine1518-N6/adenine1519-N6)-dimethyltransferase